jgi:hypothetical protein
MDTYWLLSANAKQGAVDEFEMAYTAEEGPAFMKDLADMQTYGGPNEDDENQTEM